MSAQGAEPPNQNGSVPSPKSRTGLTYDEQLTTHFCAWNIEFTEKPARLKNAYQRCESYKLVERCQNIPVREATEEEMYLCHTKAHIDLLKQTEKMSDEELQQRSQDFDFTYLDKNIYRNAKLALGAAIDLVGEVLSGKLQNGFALIRPPGHHAMNNEFCGYCYLNNIAIAAKTALDRFHLKRILILDWDVHHGQGTQYYFYDDPRVLYFSMHRYQKGSEWPNLRESDYDFVGAGEGRGYTINIPLNEIGCGNNDYMAIFFQILLPVIYEFDPELILVSAGYDSAIGCPEGEMEVSPACFAHFVNLLSPLAQGKLALLLEGGYCLETLAEGVALSIKGLLSDPCPRIAPIGPPKTSTLESILNTLKVQRPFWRSLAFQDTLEEKETPPHPSILEWPSVYNENLRTAANRPTVFPLVQDCFDKEVTGRMPALQQEIDRLKKTTRLLSPPHKVALVCCHQSQDQKSAGDSECNLSDSCVLVKQQGLLSRCHAIKGREAKMEDVQLVHSEEYVHAVEAYLSAQEKDAAAEAASPSKPTSPPSKPTSPPSSPALALLDPSAKVTMKAALQGVGAVLAVVDEVMTEKAQGGAVIGIPSGHQVCASSSSRHGVFNTVAIAAKYAQQRHKAERILIVNWDEHHAAGTQSIFEDDKSVLVVSMHWPQWKAVSPYGTEGLASEVGSGPGKGFTVNIPWSQGEIKDADYVAAFQQVVLPIAYEFCPDLVLVSGCCLNTGSETPRGKLGAVCQGHLTRMLQSFADSRVILMLEVTEDRKDMTEAASSCITALLGDTLPSLGSCVPSPSAVKSICESLDVQKNYWKSLLYRVKLPAPSVVTEHLDSIEQQQALLPQNQ